MHDSITLRYTVNGKTTRPFKHLRYIELWTSLFFDYLEDSRGKCESTICGVLVNRLRHSPLRLPWNRVQPPFTICNLSLIIEHEESAVSIWGGRHTSHRMTTTTTKSASLQQESQRLTPRPDFKWRREAKHRQERGESLWWWTRQPKVSPVTPSNYYDHNCIPYKHHIEGVLYSLQYFTRWNAYINDEFAIVKTCRSRLSCVWQKSTNLRTVECRNVSLIQYQ